MTVNELIETLKVAVSDDSTVGDRLIVLSSDAEGNRYSRLDACAEVFYVEEGHDGYVIDEEDIGESIQDGMIESKEKLIPCFCFWP